MIAAMSPEPLALPADPAGWEPWLREAGKSLLAAADTHADAVRRGEVDPLAGWNEVALAFANLSARASLLAQVHPDPRVVDLAEELEVELERRRTELLQDPALAQRLRGVDPAGLDADARRVLDLTLRDFRRAGADLDESDRERLRELEERATRLKHAFSRGIREGRRTTRVPVAALAGLDEDYRADHPAEADGLVPITTDYPDTLPLLSYSEDAPARRQVAEAFYNLGWPDNDTVLADLIETRHQLATLLGYPGWPDYDAEVKMVGRGEAIPEFYEPLAVDAAEPARAELDRLLARAAKDGIEVIDLAGWRYYAEVIKREEYDVDAHVVRRYFDHDRVREGLLAVTGRLFGLTYRRAEIASWHPDVASFDVYEGDRRIGRIHLDLHPRERKFNHAAQFDLVPGIRGRQLPEGVLVCNFPRGLMDHRDVITLFHEFGHLLHHVLGGDHEWVRFSGVATEWDFVEAPSQLLEEWAWDAGVLASFARDAAGDPIPTELVARMRAADEFGTAIWVRNQLFFTALSYRLYAEMPEDRTALMNAVYDEYSPVRPLPGTHFFAGFGHLEDYTSAYYTYLWSKVIAKDLFSAFDAADLFDADVAARYRKEILVPGGSRPAAELIERFLGRPSEPAAFQRWLGA